MNIALIGYGKMGKEIEAIALDRGHVFPLIIDINNQQDLTTENLKKCDVAIEFTTPETAYANFMKCFAASMPVVAGTTGWLDKLEQIREICEKENQRFFYTPNFSLGVNIFFRLNRFLAGIMNNFPDYQVGMTEIHHTQKLDAPSGTAIKLADDLISNVGRLKEWKLDDNGQGVLPIKAVREDQVPGTHVIKYNSVVDEIEISHVAKNRKGFALGAVLAAEFIVKQSKGVFTMDDLLNF